MVSAIDTFLTGIVIGIAYAAPIGAQNLFVIQSASSRSLAQGFIIASLVILNDIALAGVCFLGVGHLFVLNEIVRQFMIGCSSIILAVLAFKTLRTAMVSRTSFIGDNRDASNNVNFSTLNVFLTAASLTWLNPQALLDGTLLLGSYRASFSNVHLAYVFFLGVCIASMTWFTTLTCAVMFLAKRGDKNYLRAAQFGLAFMLILLSFSMLTQLFETASAAVTDTTRTVRIAILDNLKSEKLASERYVEEYQRGINLAVREAGKTKITLEPKLFLYDSKPLEILAMLPEVLAWHPDVIIGPRSSDQFMLLKDRLSNIAVISPLATAQSVTTMPGNFYSITPPNSEYTRNLASYVKQKYPGKTVVPVIEIDCMNCVNFADEFTVSARKIGINVRENPNGKFTAAEAETIAVGPLVANINLGDIILMPNRSYTSGVMMARISKHLKVADLQFIGGDGWGDWSVGYAGKMKSPFKYVGARLNAWSLKSDSPNVIFFQKLYRSTYGSPADSNIALITFSTMRLITELANPKRLNSASETQNVILQELMRRSGQDPDFAHSKSYAIFEVTQDGEFFRGVFDGN